MIKEIIVMDLNARKKLECWQLIQAGLLSKTKATDFKALNLGFELPNDFLTQAGPQPTLAELTVLAQKLDLRIKITSIEIELPKDETAADGK